ncbi:MAG: hypothetical protein ACTSPI_00340 [Candidatus Heimdallarchaeaceae archaeon]
MEKFVAEKPDLVLELTTLSGEEITLEPTEIISGTVALNITEKWKKLEEEAGDKSKSPLEILATELSYIYPKNARWFLDNFDFGTLNEILVYVAQTVGGIKKKSKNLKQ